MAINNETHISKTVILPREIAEQVERLAKENDRSLSSQIVFMVKQQLKEDSK